MRGELVKKTLAEAERDLVRQWLLSNIVNFINENSASAFWLQKFYIDLFPEAAKSIKKAKGDESNEESIKET